MSTAQKPFASIFTFSRASTGTRINSAGVMETIAANQPRFDYEPADVPILGAELVANGDFSSGGTGWSVNAGFTFSGGAMQINANGGAATNSGASAAVPQKKYLVSFDVASLSSGAIKAFVGDVGGGTIYGAGHYEDTIVASGTTKPQIYVMSAGTVCAVDNFSVREILGYTARKGDPKGILIEEQRTNLLTHSNDFSATGWNGSNWSYLNRTPGAFSYAGLSFSAVALSQTGQPAYFGASTVSANAGESFTASILAAPKSVSNHYAISIRGTYPRRVDAIFNLSTGALVWSGGVTWTGLSAKSTNMGGGVWCLEITGTAPVTEPVNMLHGPCESSAQGAWEGGRAVLCDAYISAAQFEKGASRTSHIPTSGSQVTRAADVCLINTLSPWFKTTEGCFVFEGEFGKGRWQVTGKTSYLDILGTDNIGVNGFVRNASGNIIVTSGQLPSTAKLAVSWGAAGSKVCVNGGTVQTGAGVPDFSSGTVVSIGRGFDAASYLNGHVRRLRFFQKQPSDASHQSSTA